MLGNAGGGDGGGCEFWFGGLIFWWFDVLLDFDIFGFCPAVFFSVFFSLFTSSCFSPPHFPPSLMLLSCLLILPCRRFLCCCFLSHFFLSYFFPPYFFHSLSLLSHLSPLPFMTDPLFQPPSPESLLLFFISPFPPCSTSQQISSTALLILILILSSF